MFGVFAQLTELMHQQYEEQQERQSRLDPSAAFQLLRQLAAVLDELDADADREQRVIGAAKGCAQPAFEPTRDFENGKHYAPPD